MSEIDTMLAANERWAERFPGSRDVHPARKVAVVSCMDSRMPLFQMLGLEVGDAHVLGTREILLVHHSQCGMQATDDTSFSDQVQEATGRRPPWAVRAFRDAAD